MVSSVKLKPEHIKIIPWIDRYTHAYDLRIGFTDYKNRKHYQLFSITRNAKNGEKPEYFLESAIKKLQVELNKQLKHGQGYFHEIHYENLAFHYKRWKAKKWWIAKKSP